MTDLALKGSHSSFEGTDQKVASANLFEILQCGYVIIDMFGNVNHRDQVIAAVWNFKHNIHFKKLCIRQALPCLADSGG